MKRIYLILSVFSILFISCETDVDVNAQWEEIVVVYGLLDQDQELQFVKVNKAFLGDDAAYIMAQQSDSFNLHYEYPDAIIVSLHELNGQDTAWTRVLRDTILEREEIDDPIFATDNNVVYYLETNQGELNKDREYVLTVENTQTGNFVYSKTELVPPFTFDDFDGTSGSIGNPTPAKLNFHQWNQDQEANTAVSKFEWYDYDDAAIFQFGLRFHYKEDGEDKSIYWRQSEVYEDIEKMFLYGNDFCNFLESNLDADGSSREFISIDIEMTVGSQDLKTYVLVNKPSTSIVQERPQFSNIQNGIGLFSSRYSLLIENIDLSPTTYDYLRDSIPEYNFQ
tara:strand:+ start:565 stop:1578 length:1014 start_codon:yes stop_codon:yes gene_type:complete